VGNSPSTKKKKKRYLHLPDQRSYALNKTIPTTAHHHPQHPSHPHRSNRNRKPQAHHSAQLHDSNALLPIHLYPQKLETELFVREVV
jgi:hypothetical protein